MFVKKKIISCSTCQLFYQLFNLQYILYDLTFLPNKKLQSKPYKLIQYKVVYGILLSTSNKYILKYKCTYYFIYFSRYFMGFFLCVFSFITVIFLNFNSSTAENYFKNVFIVDDKLVEEITGKIQATRIQVKCCQLRLHVFYI